MASHPLPTAQQAAVRLAAGQERPRLLVRGPARSGKTTLVAALRGTFPAALIVDDAHDLPAAALAGLVADVESASGPVVVAMQPRQHDEALRALAAAFARGGTIVDLGALTAADVARLAPEVDAQLLVHLTGGSPDGVYAIVDALRSGEQAADAASSWARARLRTEDPDVLATLALAASGVGLDPADVAAAVNVSAPVATTLVDRVRSSGLLDDADRLLPTVVEPLRGALGARRFGELQLRVLETSIVPSSVAVRLADLGVRDPGLVAILTGHAARAEPADAARLYAAALTAGVDPDSIAVEYADAAARSGDLATAQTIADRILARPGAEAAELAAAVRILGACWAQRGRLDRSADLYAWLGPGRVGADAGLATAVLYAVGRPDDAARFADAPDTGPPTDQATAATALGLAVAASTTGPAAGAVNALVRLASGTVSTQATPLDAVAVAVASCLHNGEIERAAALVDRAGPTPLRILLGAWTAMLAGDDDAARSGVDTLAATALDGRDSLHAHGIRVGLARRSGDHGTLLAAWAAAQRVLDEIVVDVFALLPLGELWLAAIRAGDAYRMDHLIAEATELLNRLGGARAWANTFHWYGVQAALLADQPAALVPHARALGRAAEHPAGDRYAAALASAGRTWLRVVRSEAEPADVERSAQTLGTIGLPWDGARLASEAALRAADTATATALLQIARELRQRTAPAPSDSGPANPLSEREADVAQLLVLGLTYREVGSRLYISAKTVEHHVARIRRRLGAGSRSELLSMLRALGYGDREGDGDQNRSPGV